MELYFKLKAYTGLIIVGLIFLAITITIVAIAVSIAKETRKENYLLFIGFEKKLWRVSTTGNNPDYYWRRGTDRIEDYEFKKMSLRELKKKYKQLKKN